MTTLPSSSRVENLQRYIDAVGAMLKEKEAHYGVTGGFYETNANGNYTHALGEAKLKLSEFHKTRDTRMLIKAATWIYLILEDIHGPEQNRTGR